MPDELVPLFQHPSLPDSWSYDESIKKMKGFLYKFKNLQRDVANELWIAREILSRPGARTDLTSSKSGQGYTWTGYCEKIDVARSTIDNWLRKWFPESLSLENKPLIESKHCIDWIKEQGQCDLLLTDPPYVTDVDDIYEFAESWLNVALDKVKPTGRAYICIGAYPSELKAYLLTAETSKIRLCNILVWTYQNTLGPQPSHDYKLNWQAILYFRGADAPPLNAPMMTEQFSVMPINAPDGRQADRYHEWQKPLELAERLIRQSTKEDDIVLDPFVGTGTFILAANRLGRIGFGCDIDETALDIAVKRGCAYGKLDR